MKHRFVLRAALAAIFAAQWSPTTVSAVMNFPNCDPESFYKYLISADLLGDKAEMTTLLAAMHRKVVPYTSTAEDVWDALIDLDRHLPNQTVDPIYTSTFTPATPYGTPTTWNREHLYPKSHGIGKSGPDFSDLHALRPSDWNINSARSNRYFGSCGVALGGGECVTPAHPEAAADTSRDGLTFFPPVRVRGDVARAVFYAVTRYTYLKVSDCPEEEGGMGYLSQLLEWHEEDGVSEEEIVRNGDICNRWQGNRNPFVDYPHLVKEYFGEASVPLGEGLGYNCFRDSSQAPMGAPVSAPVGSGPVECEELKPGSVMFTGFRSDNPDAVVMVAIDDIPAGVELFLTDNKWTGSELKSTEGVKKLVVPNGGISSGSTFGYGSTSDPLSSSWQSVSGSLALATNGDNLFLYCLDDNYSTRPFFVSGLSYSLTGWSPADTTALPSNLPTNCALSLPHYDNYIYKGLRTGKRGELLTALTTQTNWVGSNDGRLFDINSALTPFDVIPLSIAPTPGPMSLDTCRGMVPGDVMIVGFHADNPDSLAIVALKGIPAKAKMYSTDNAWTGSTFKSNEGVKELLVHTGGIPSGSVFGYGNATLQLSDNWRSTFGSFALSSSGDNIFLYCLSSDGTPRILSGLLYNGDNWSPPGDEGSFSTGQSALPSNLPSNCAVALSHDDNYSYTGTRYGGREELLDAISTASNWSGESQKRMEYPDEFSIDSSRS